MRVPSIEISGLGKSYRLGKQEFWALRDISLSVHRGEVLGIVGRNGAGKTTLLRILARITEPTRGRAVVRGRIGTLLETGTGFHDDLSGRENVYLNGAILGMRPHEIRRGFDEIVEFSGIGRFIDSAVKSYSSGMRSRLAFSVAAHLETEILLVDEVLAVGDLAFQEKCLRKMDGLVRGGDRTILFVSHSMGAIQSLCTRAIMIEDGRVAMQGEVSVVIDAYNKLMTAGSEASTPVDAAKRPGDGSLRFVGLRLQDLEGKPVETIRAGAGMRLLLDYEYPLGKPPRDLSINIGLIGSKGLRLLNLSTEVVAVQLPIKSKGTLVCTVPALPLMPGFYGLDIGCLVDRALADKLINMYHLTVTESDFYGTGRLPPVDLGDVLVGYSWSHET
jgi:lipopolysaccharide transport system ATP-binding protein